VTSCTLWRARVVLVRSGTSFFQEVVQEVVHVVGVARLFQMSCHGLGSWLGVMAWSHGLESWLGASYLL